ncbi:HDIG domain-containing protein [Candidatus Woesearchaeota archaeon]|nr:HDIG domain-containing protein [Candidatus Woesearchaeota archaeon]
MKDIITEEFALKLLKRYSKSGTKGSYRIVSSDAKRLSKLAVAYAKKAVKNGHDIDIGFVASASLLHDIGRFRYPPFAKDNIRHGIEGARILKKEGLSRRYQDVCLNHIGAGLRRSDIIRQNLPLPKKDFMPKTKEEIIISYADLRFHEGRVVGIVRESRRYESFQKGLGKRVLQFHNRVMKLIGADNKVRNIR